jgi:16S rRNA (cytidine1402-2'-O)-methyltransferase
LDTLNVVEQVLGSEREVVLAKELTKHYEAFCKGRCQDVVDWLNDDKDRLQGEMVIMLSPNKVEQDLSPEAEALLRRLIIELPIKKSAAITAELHGLKKNDLYKLALTWQDVE